MEDIEKVEMKQLANDIAEEITGRAVPDTSKLKMEDFVEYRMRQIILDLRDSDAPMRDKWKEFMKREKLIIAELQQVPRTRVKTISLKKFISYYKEVVKLQDALVKEIEESYIEGESNEVIVARN